MMINRSSVVTAAVAAAAALAATGITYASAASQFVATAAPAAPAAYAQAPYGGGGNNNGNNNNGNNNNGYNNNGKGNEGKGNEGRGGEEHEEEGRIQINERTYSSHPGGCITVVSGLGARTLNIRNDSRKRVEVFRGAVCDNGAPVATVGPHSSAEGVKPGHTDGVHVEDGVIGSFRVVGHRKGGEEGDED
jgi:hypothetical protein